ncbi:MAG: hypothetical protein ACOC93_02365 [Planctomycetota bacterium]
MAWSQNPSSEVGEHKLQRPGEYTRHELHLPGVLRDGSEMVLNLGEQGGKIRQAWAVCPTHNTAGRQVEVDQFRLKDGKLTGTTDV